MELNLLKPMEAAFDVDGAAVTLQQIDPFLQAKIAEHISSITNTELTDQLVAMHFIFEQVVKSIVYKDATYTGSEFFKLLSITDESNQAFIAEVISNIVEIAFVSKSEAKK